MKSIFLLNIAVLFLCIGTALAVAVYSEDYGRNRIIGYEQQHLTAGPAPEEIEASLSLGHLSSSLRQMFQPKNSPPEVAATTFPQNRIFQPMAIFLFGAGLVGVATLTKRKLNL